MTTFRRTLTPILRLLAGVALFALVLWLIGPARVMRSIAQADPVWLGAGFAASLLASLASALRWHAIAAWLGIHAARRELMLAYWRGVMANTILPGATVGGDTLRALSLQRLGHPLPAAAVSVLLDRLSGLWMLVVMSLVMTSLAQTLRLLPRAVLDTPPALAAAIANLLLLAPLPAWWCSNAISRRLPQRVANMLAVLHTRPHPFGQYLTQMTWSSIVQLLSITAFACGGYAVGLQLHWWQFVIAAGPVFVFAALPVSIGGWGTREAAAALVLGALTGGDPASREAAVACAILYGVFATAQGLLGALSFFLNKGPSHDR